MRRQEHFVFQNAHCENLMLICEAKGKLWAITSLQLHKEKSLKHLHMGVFSIWRLHKVFPGLTNNDLKW